MTVQKRFYELISGRKTGWAASLLRGGLQCLEMPYCAVVSVRNALYDHQMLPICRNSLPVISVGNLSLGGTGKSPMVVWLCRWFLEQNRRPGLISRGYGKLPHEVNDEFMELSHRFPKVPHVQHRKRAEAIQRLRKTNEIDLIILDDAFQHRQVARDIDLVILDATAPFGFEHIFPRGTLRESLKGLRRADIVLLSRSDLVSETEREQIHRRVLSINPNIIWGETIHAPISLVSWESFHEDPLESLAGKSALACCGIANPAAFQKTLEQCGVRVVNLISFPDHYAYTGQDADEIQRTAKELGTDLILCTMKDLVKLNRFEFTSVPLQAVAIEIRFTHGESAVCERLMGSSSFFR